MNNAIDLTARLLATENLTVMKQAVSTACFNVEKRELILPIFKDMTNEIEQMLVCHEVGHALYTTVDMLEASKELPNLHTYINVVEDVRIEKLMKRKYPGIKKVMLEGYKQLNDQDFFGVNEIEDHDDLLLIDRINLWFKVGISSGVSFSDKENQFIDRAEKTETPDEVIQLAKDLYEFTKEELEQKRQEQQEERGEGKSKVVGEVTEETDEDSEGENELDSITDKSFNQKLDDAVDTLSNERRYLSLDPEYDPDTLIGYKTVLEELSNVLTLESITNHYGQARYDYDTKSYVSAQVEYNKFRTNALKTVNYLLKEFDMKKAATNYKRTTVSKTGSLDMKKIWGYQLNDDLFKRVSITKDGKKHGMQILVDWSGSMSGVIEDVMQQVIILSMFCYRAQIPFQVLAFTDAYRSYGTPYNTRKIDRNAKYEANPNLLDNAVNNCRLIEFFNSKMTSKEFNEMCKIVFNTHAVITEYHLGATPLNDALAYMVDYTGKFISKHSIEKMSFITLTDGQGDRLRTRYTKMKKSDDYIIDPRTKLVYDFNESDSTLQTDMLLKMIKDRYNVTNIGFYIAGKATYREIQGAIWANGAYTKGNPNQVEETKSSIRKNGFASFTTKGRDNLFIVPAKSIKIEEVEYEVNATSQSAASIANKFGRALEANQTNKLLLNQFIKQIA